MNPEDILRRFRLHAPADAARGRVLAAARRARLEKRLWRWTWAAAAVVLTIAIPVNVMMERSVPAAGNPQIGRELSEVVRAVKDESLRSRLTLALTSRTARAERPSIEEILP